MSRWLCVLMCWLAFCGASFAQDVGAPPTAANSPSATVIASPPVLPSPPAATPAAPINLGRDITVGLRELSPWSMFQSATLIVQAIIVGLAFASLLTWTIFIAKLIELLMIRRRLSAALASAVDARTLSEAKAALARDKSVMRTFIATALNEERLSADIPGGAGVNDRAASSFAETLRAESRRIRVGMSLIATIAATAPFVGLFGTVWGIMNSFIGISKSQTTNLAVVAPGIAEALLATAIGLFAAIPAVVIYNHLTRATKGYMELANRAAGVVVRQLSRDLDRRSSLGPLRQAAE